MAPIDLGCFGAMGSIGSIPVACRFNLTAIVVLIIQNGDDYYFAEELANALGVTVKAPNDLLYIMPSGRMYVGEARDGKFIDYHPNQRGRKK